MPESQIKSKERVAERGEVFTAAREVNAMLDLVKQETERIDSRFLEPACGTGNFLVEILRRKLDVIWQNNTQRYGRKMDHEEIDRQTVQAVCSIYGIDIMPDNVEECRLRLLAIIREWYPHAHLGGTLEGKLLRTLEYVLACNILWGDALTLCEPERPDRPIVFAEWSFVGEGKVKRRDYTLDMLLKNQPIEEANLFSDLGDEAFIPTPCKEYKPVKYLKLYTQDVAQ